MKRILKLVTFVLLFIWKLPQSIMALIIFLREDALKSDKQVLNHETGHVKQSWLLGWFYLIVIGIPSYINHIRSGYNDEFRQKYYTVYPEKWADKLGGVKRK